MMVILEHRGHERQPFFANVILGRRISQSFYRQRKFRGRPASIAQGAKSGTSGPAVRKLATERRRWVDGPPTAISIRDWSPASEEDRQLSPTAERKPDIPLSAKFTGTDRRHCALCRRPMGNLGFVEAVIRSGSGVGKADGRPSTKNATLLLLGGGTGSGR